jgi:hypothetical protein
MKIEMYGFVRYLNERINAKFAIHCTLQNPTAQDAFSTRDKKNK